MPKGLYFPGYWTGGGRTKPPPGTPLLSHKLTEFDPKRGGLILCAAFLEGQGFATVDSGPLRAQTFPGASRTAASEGLNGSVTTATSIFSGWRATSVGPGVRFAIADTTDTGAPITQASCIDFRLPRPLTTYWADTTAPISFVYQFFNDGVNATGGFCPQLFSMGTRDGVNGGWIPYYGSETGSNFPFTFGNNGTEQIIANTTAWGPRSNAMNICGMASAGSRRTMFSNNVVGVNTQATGGVQSHDSDIISVGAGWINGGQLSMDGGEGGGWEGALAIFWLWNNKRSDAELLFVRDYPYFGFATPAPVSYFSMGGSSTTPTPTSTQPYYYQMLAGGPSV